MGDDEPNSKTPMTRSATTKEKDVATMNIPANAPKRQVDDELFRFPLDVPTRRHEAAILWRLFLYFPALRPVFDHDRLVAITGTRRDYLGLVATVRGGVL